VTAHLAFLAALVIAGSRSAQQTPDTLGAKRNPCPSLTIPPQPKPAPPRCGLHCGTERWQVKTLSDPDTRRVRLIPVATTVESLAALPRPRYLPSYGRSGPTETTIFCVEGWLKDFTTEPDFDIHVIVGGLDDTTATIIAEFPDARCSGVCASGFRQLMASARQALERKLGTFSTDTLRVRIMGVGFFDRPHGQYGAAPNNIELHPVLGIEFP
jgi:hypothetical protein